MDARLKVNFALLLIFTTDSFLKTGGKYGQLKKKREKT